MFSVKVKRNKQFIDINLNFYSFISYLIILIHLKLDVVCFLMLISLIYTSLSLRRAPSARSSLPPVIDHQILDQTSYLLLESRRVVSSQAANQKNCTFMRFLKKKKVFFILKMFLIKSRYEGNILVVKRGVGGERQEEMRFNLCFKKKTTNFLKKYSHFFFFVFKSK